jgi:hypothetical protein
VTPHDAHAWWSRLRHQGLLLSPVVLLDRYKDAPPRPPFYQLDRLRDAWNRFDSAPAADAATLAWTDALLERFCGNDGRLARQGDIPANLKATVRIGSRTEPLTPHRVLYADAARTTPALARPGG